MNLLLTVLLSRFLGPSGKGLAALLVTNIALFLIFFNLIGGATLVYLSPRYATKSLLGISYLWTLGLAPILCLLAGLIHLIPGDHLLAVGVLAVMDSLFGIHSNLLLGKEKVRTVNALQFARAFVNVLAAVVFFVVWHAASIESFLKILGIGYTAVLAVSFMALVPLIKKDNKANGWLLLDDKLSIFKHSILLGGNNQLAHILQFANLRLSYFFLTQFGCDQHEGLGIYSNGVSLSESVWMISNSMAMVQYAKIANSGQLRESMLLTRDLMKISLLLSFLALTALLLLPAQFYSGLFGSGFSGIRAVLFTLSPGILLYSLVLLLDHYFSGIGKFKINIQANAVGLAATLACSAFFIGIKQEYNSFYAGITASISYTCNFAVLMYFYRKDASSLTA